MKRKIHLAFAAIAIGCTPIIAKVTISACGEKFHINEKNHKFGKEWKSKGMAYLKRYSKTRNCSVVIPPDTKEVKEISIIDKNVPFDPTPPFKGVSEPIVGKVVANNGKKKVASNFSDLMGDASEIIDRGGWPKVFYYAEAIGSDGEMVLHKLTILCEKKDRCYKINTFKEYMQPEYQMRNRTFLEQNKGKIKKIERKLRGKTISSSYSSAPTGKR